MNRATVLRAGLAAAVTALAFDADAITAKAGLEACTEALVEKIGAEQGLQPTVRFDTGSTLDSRMPGHGNWYLDVRHPVSDEIIARADCRVNRLAKVTMLTTLPLTAASAEIRARQVE